MTTGKLSGQIKQTAGKVTGNTGMQVEGTIQKGIAGAKKVAGGAVNFVADAAGTLVNTVSNLVSDAYTGVKKLINKVF